MKIIIFFVLSIYFLADFHSSMAHAEMDSKSKNAIQKTASVENNSVFILNQRWINESDEQVDLKSFLGKKHILAMIFTRCPSACPLIVQDIRDLLKKVPANLRDTVHVRLFSFDSKRENKKSLADFRYKFKLEKNWSLYRGDESTVSVLAALLSVQYRRLENGDYVHSNQIFLINEQGQVSATIEGFDAARSDFVKKLSL